MEPVDGPKLCLQCLKAGVTTPLVSVSVATTVEKGITDVVVPSRMVPTWQCPRNPGHRQQETSI